ncbi:AAA_2 domain-containing protein [Cephalotus follicularis]|uniref:AAA_2 domain-containing protein n=1 Tax=Cephalotus follicularis TaxID=3775 RepID=A0A1Q3BF03_CEPFO|nr:AAA_2 domain-containing protein [Cephalotus follicularis]
MPTPVNAARQCLTEEAARSLDDAVAVARRRSHAQTTSLHAVSALLAMPSSALREACARARGSAFSTRLQFRALELCVGVHLDRLQSSKSVEDPPISNSLMAAIKRSQANQRRHPESYHLQQMHINQQTASLLKVELKHFILSILDDPIVSRVFSEAGFRSHDLKLAMIHPPVTSAAYPRFSRSRCPPIFLCNLTDSELGQGNIGSPFCEDVDENCKKIGEVLVKKSGKNPLLVGVCANDALKSFTECVEKEKRSVLPGEVSGLSVVCVEKEVTEFVSGGGSEEKLGSKFEDLRRIVVEKKSDGPGVIVNFGELMELIGDGVSSEDAMRFVVSKLTNLLVGYSGKLWLMGAVASYEIFAKFLRMFPTIEKDWDLHPLPITSFKPSVGGVCSKSSLMGSFVPFGGFFSTTSGYKTPLSSFNQSSTRCKLCNGKYEQEVAVIMKVRSTSVSVSDQYSEKLPSWLQMTELDTSKEVDLPETQTTGDGSTLNAKILRLQRKWNDFCQRVHHTQLFPKSGISQFGSSYPAPEGLRFVAERKEMHSKDSSLKESHCANLRQSIPGPVASEAENVNFHTKELDHASKSQQIKEPVGALFTSSSLPNFSVSHDSSSSHSIAPLTTDLGLGTLYASTQQPETPTLHDHIERLHHFSGSISAEFDSISENASFQIVQSYSSSGRTLGEHFDPREYKTLRRILAEKVGRQDEAIDTISQAISRCKTGNGRCRRSNSRGDIWLTFLGPDKVGKKRVASALAEIMCGNRESLISVDLSSYDRVCQSNSIFVCEELNDYDVKFRGKTVVDYLVGELSKKSRTVVFLENVDKAEICAQSSLYHAIRTGKLSDSHGREISINNMILVSTATISKDNKIILLEEKPIKYSEKRILGAKNRQMQLQVGCVPEDASRSKDMDVRVAPRRDTLNSNSVSVNKRKLTNTIDSAEQEPTRLRKCGYKAMRSYLDLNLPVEEMEQDINCHDTDSDSISENSEAWLEDFFDNVDEKVIFKPYDFDALAEKIIKQINLQFGSIFGSEVLLLVDDEFIVQILAAAWLSEGTRGMEDWVEKVLRRTFAHAQQKYRVTAGSVVKLVVCEGIFVEEQAPGVRLPAHINVK